MDKSKRALRRHHVKRLEKKFLRENYWGINDISFSQWVPSTIEGRAYHEERYFTEKEKREKLGMLINCRKPYCHHWGCCHHVRFIYGYTLKELINVLKKEEGIEEYDESKVEVNS